MINTIIEFLNNSIILHFTFAGAVGALIGVLVVRADNGGMPIVNVIAGAAIGFFGGPALFVFSGLTDKVVSFIVFCCCLPGSGTIKFIIDFVSNFAKLRKEALLNAKNSSE